jgi:ATP-dependent exoDNAse (exonuclease V) beta subunit
MTIHAAKGLEFDTVFLVGWEEGVFPSQRALDEGGNASLEEERRLAYVAITRARRRATILHAANRRIYGQWTSSIPSRFVNELPAEHIESETTMSGRRKSCGARNGASKAIPSRMSRANAPHMRDARARLAARRDQAARHESDPSGRGEIERGELRRQAARRYRGRPARLPHQVRLRHDRRDRGQQAGDRFRAGRPQARARQFRDGATSMP